MLNALVSFYGGIKLKTNVKIVIQTKTLLKDNRVLGHSFVIDVHLFTKKKSCVMYDHIVV